MWGSSHPLAFLRAGHFVDGVGAAESDKRSNTLKNDSTFAHSKIHGGHRQKGPRGNAEQCRGSKRDILLALCVHSAPETRSRAGTHILSLTLTQPSEYT